MQAEVPEDHTDADTDIQGVLCAELGNLQAEISGIDRKEVDKAMAELKKEGAIVSPKRCYWTAAK